MLHYDKQSKQANFLHARVVTESPLKPFIILAQAALEESKLDETYERGPEIGVDSFIVFNAERSERLCYAKALKKVERFTRITQDAARQSGRLFVPEIILCDCLSMAIKQSSECLMLVGAIFEAERLSLLLEKSEQPSKIKKVKYLWLKNNFPDILPAFYGQKRLLGLVKGKYSMNYRF